MQSSVQFGMVEAGSTCCIVNKVMERCVFDSIYPHLKPRISEHQHGFVSGKSTATQLSRTYHTIGTTLDNGGQTDIVFLDLAKAFDSVPHDLLLHKLTSFGINGNLLRWFGAYVHGRKQRVIVEGAHSGWLPVLSGVPQGSILGPLLFILYINDLPQCASSSVELFADDAKCYRSIASLDDCRMIQKDLDALLKWSQKWKLTFSPDKCKVLTVSRRKNNYIFKYCLNGIQLERVNNFADLGVNISHDLSFHDHVKAKVNKANSMVGLIKRTTSKLPAPHVMVKLFETLVRTHLEYCCQVWSPHNKRDIVLIERVQRGFTKSILHGTSLSYKDRLLHLGLLPLSYRREIADLIFFFKCVHGLYDFVLSESALATEQSNRLRSGNAGLMYKQLKCKTLTFQCAYVPRVIGLWNSLPLGARQASELEQFRDEVKAFYATKLLTTFTTDNTCTWVSNCKCPACRA
jgi:hypothetical protein